MNFPTFIGWTIFQDSLNNLRTIHISAHVISLQAAHLEESNTEQFSMWFLDLCSWKPYQFKNACYSNNVIMIDFVQITCYSWLICWNLFFNKWFELQVFPVSLQTTELYFYNFTFKQ